MTLELPNTSTPAKNQIRKALRQQRRSLSPHQQKHASMGLCRQLSLLPEFIFGQRIAAYIPNDGEIDPQPLLELAWRLGKQIYLPVLHPFSTGRLLFMAHHPHQVLAKNRFGIPEPLCDQDSHCPVWTLDLVLTPLVGFDENGNRMGMGGGFYDRTFAFLNDNSKPRKPRMIGVAHECQKVDTLPNERWDIMMNKIVTDKDIYSAR
ncbi:5-formyltetrahydrofolate cyclo-ligase [Ketobacter alkanivorans]|uniref:5-formyltetrahydrofolate cyclo-ligase n=1 Tax=Ketobacter alkanivorans TaxID=1917421 RepID=UPI001F25E8A4|nr:5-formyltetrahydrofolate cyclo-ligase [Ketobacter alkanivorans]